jgi:hypothetical protein
MKSAFFATIFMIVGGVAILLASPSGDKRAALEFRQARAELGLPPQIEDDVALTERDLAVIPEPVDQYSSVQVKPKIPTTTPRHRQVARRHLNFLEKLFVSFINLQKHQPAKTATKGSHLQKHQPAKTATKGSHLQKQQPAKAATKGSHTTSRRG